MHLEKSRKNIFYKELQEPCFQEYENVKDGKTSTIQCLSYPLIIQFPAFNQPNENLY